MNLIAKRVGGESVAGRKILKLSTAVIASLLISSCATDTSASPTSEPEVFSSTSQCTQPLMTTGTTPQQTGQYATWAAACVSKSGERGLSIEASAHALQNAAKLFYADALSQTDAARAAGLNQAAAQAKAATDLLNTRPETKAAIERELRPRYQFDTAFTSIAPMLELGLMEGSVERGCGTASTCLTDGLSAMRTVEVGTVRPVLSDTNRAYQRAAVDLQFLHAKANAKLAETSSQGDVISSLEVLKSLISVVPVEGNADWSGQARTTLLEIAEASAARVMTEEGGYDQAIRYLTEASQVASGDRQKAINLDLGMAHETRADALLSNDLDGDDSAGLASYCAAANSYDGAEDQSSALKSLQALEGQAYALSQIAAAGSSECDASYSAAIDAYAAAESYRTSASLPGSYKHLGAYGQALVETGTLDNIQKSVEVFDLQQVAGRDLPATPGTGKPEPDEEDALVLFPDGPPQARGFLTLAVRFAKSSDPAERQQATSFFERAQGAARDWPTAYTEHAKFLAETSTVAASNQKLSMAIARAEGDPAKAGELAEAYHVRSQNALRLGNGLSALRDGKLAMRTSSNPIYRRQTCLSAVLTGKGGTTATDTTTFCESSVGSTEDLLLDAFLKYRLAQIARRTDLREGGNTSERAFQAAGAAFNAVIERDDSDELFKWPLPDESYSYVNAGRFGAWLSTACVSARGGPPRPTNTDGQDLAELFQTYGVAACDGR